MGRPCSVCVHPQAVAIDRTLHLRAESNRSVASRFGLSETAVRRHRAHMPPHVPDDVGQADELVAKTREGLERMEALEAKAAAILQQASGTGDTKLALAAIREFARVRGELRANVELMARLQGDLSDRPTVNILVAPEWLRIRSAVVDALTPFPEARDAVARRLSALEGVTDKPSAAS